MPSLLHADAPENKDLQWRGYGTYAYKKPYNFLSVSASAGYSNLLTHDKISTPMGMGGCTFGIGYEMHSNMRNFWWSFGAEMEYLTSADKVNSEVGERFIYDTEGYLAVMHYDINRWRDYQQMIFVSVPLMFGYRTERFYIGAGPKLMLCAFSEGRNKLEYTTSATYDRYGDDFVYMPNHYYTKQTSTSLPAKLQSSITANVALCFEVGGIVYDETFGAIKMPGTKEKLNPRVVLKVGFNAEYGFLNQNQRKGTETLATVREDAAHIIDVVPLYTSTALINNTVNPLYAGVKLTLLVNFYCRNCKAIK